MIFGSYLLIIDANALNMAVKAAIGNNSTRGIYLHNIAVQHIINQYAYDTSFTMKVEKPYVD